MAPYQLGEKDMQTPFQGSADAPDRFSHVQAASDVVSEVERAVEQYSKGVGHLCQKLPLPGEILLCAQQV